MRDHRKLVAFQAADELVVDVYRIVRTFPAHERFGLAFQLRRAAVSIAANMVEGCARETAADYARFLSVAYGSACETQYEIDLAGRLGYLDAETCEKLRQSAARASQLLSRLLRKVQSFRDTPDR